jgi:hypothetical protein
MRTDMPMTSELSASTVASSFDAQENCLPRIDDVTADVIDSLISMDVSGKENVTIRGVPVHVFASLSGEWDPSIFARLGALFNSQSQGAIYIDHVNHIESNVLVSIRAGGIKQVMMPENLPILHVAQTIVLWTVRPRGDKMVGVIDKLRKRTSCISTFRDGFTDADRSFGNAIESLGKYIMTDSNQLQVFDYSNLADDFENLDLVHGSN